MTVSAMRKAHGHLFCDRGPWLAPLESIGLPLGYEVFRGFVTKLGEIVGMWDVVRGLASPNSHGMMLAGNSCRV